jgi:excisionase family DNA binding protein
MNAAKSKRTGSPAPSNPTYMSPKEVAKYLGITRRTVYTFLNNGTIAGMKIGPGSWRISRESLDKMLKPAK